jgi:hypothetical protein
MTDEKKPHGNKGKCHTPEDREMRSMLTKQLWDDPVFRATQTARLKELSKDPKIRADRSARMKERWKDPAYREKQNAVSRAWWADPANREEQAVRWNDPDFRAGQAAGANAQFSDPKARELQSRLTKEQWADPNFKGGPTGRGKGAYVLHPNGNLIWLRSSYEILFSNILAMVGILDWEYEKLFRLEDEVTYRPDFYLPGCDIYFEVKGYMQPDAFEKLVQMSTQYPNVDLRVLYNKDIRCLEDLIKRGACVDITKFGTPVKCVVADGYETSNRHAKIKYIPTTN